MTGAHRPGTAPVDPVGAAIDIGSNSAHLLVAALPLGGEGEFDPLDDESVFLGLGERVAAAGHLGPAARATVTEALAAYVERARSFGAADGAILLLGTEPVRRAADAPRLVAEVAAATGCALHVLGHDEEAWCTLVGVTGGRRIGRPLAVVDSGGGSTEVAVVGPDGRHEAHGFRLGSATLTTAHVRHDPPTQRELEAMRAEARRLLGRLPAAPAAEAIGVGGSASNLAKAIPAAAADRLLTRARLAGAIEELLATPAADLVERYRLNPRRAPLLPAGAAIVDAVLERLGVDELRVSEAGVREGALLAASRAGAGWRDALPRLAAGWRRP